MRGVIMFHILEVEDIVRIPPAKFKYDLKETITGVVSDEKVGYLDNDVGVVLGVIDIKDVGDASVILGDGAAYVKTKYRVITFKPELHNVYEGNVKDVAEFGAFVDIGPFDGLVHVSQIMDDFINFDAKNMNFVGKESKNVLNRDDPVIARLVSVSMKGNVTQSKLGLTMRQDGLGKLDWVGKEKAEKPEKKEKVEKKKEEKKPAKK